MSMRITLDFKDSRREMEWLGGKVNAKLIGIILWSAWLLNQHDRTIRITHIFRTHAEQMAIYGSDSVVTSLHELWRAVDISVLGLSEERIADLIGSGNRAFPYDKNRPQLKTFLRHDMGEGDHIHVQVMA